MDGTWLVPLWSVLFLGLLGLGIWCLGYEPDDER